MLSIHQHLYAVSYNSHLLVFNERLFTGAFFPGSVRGVQSQPTSQQPPTQFKARNRAQKQIKNILRDTHCLQCETEGDSVNGSLARKS